MYDVNLFVSPDPKPYRWVKASRNYLERKAKREAFSTMVDLIRL